VYGGAVSDQQSPTDFNRRVGRNLQRFRKAADLSQADLAEMLSGRGLPFQQQTILKVEKGTRPLRFEEALAIAQILRINVASLSEEHLLPAEVAAAASQLGNALAGIALRRHQMAELETEIKHSEVLAREAERRLAAAGAEIGEDGAWHWDDGRVAALIHRTGTPGEGEIRAVRTAAARAQVERDTDG
jgi:transcriptional regulator with XRE-family HTH domain